ncbi:MAG: DUF4281 domain-containing protein [Myxococcales bacterium]|nr:DUF4281 domain-containing protein [Myxococcales bacterium]
MNFLFHFSALSVLPFWAAMILFPRSSWTDRLVATPWIILPATLCYLAAALPNLPEIMSIFQDPSPRSLAVVQGQAWAATMNWAYAGAFDLFVGRWMFLDARTSAISHWLVAPVLCISILLGPLGFTLYGVAKAVRWMQQRQTAAASS